MKHSNNNIFLAKVRQATTPAMYNVVRDAYNYVDREKALEVFGVFFHKSNRASIVADFNNDAVLPYCWHGKDRSK